MLNFLLDIAPDKSQLLLTIKLAGILREKKQEVYYTYTSNPAFTPVLYDKGISNCVLYPDDFRWLKPDLTLLDCRHAAHASLYRQLAIDYIFIAMQLPDQKNIQDKDISILYLPSTPYLSSGSGPRLETLTKRLQDIKKDKERNIIVGLLGKGNKNSKILEDFYRVIKRSSIRNPRYQFILLTDIPNVYQSSELPDNMELFRTLNLNTILPLCDLALTDSHSDAWLDCTFAQIPVLKYSPKDMINITPMKLEQQIEYALQNKTTLTQKAKELCDFFERMNREINKIADMLIERAGRNRYNSCRLRPHTY